jgi:lysozyme
MTLEESKKAESFVAGHEGRKLKPYRDSKGILSIGIGRNLEGKGITDDECHYLFANDIKEKSDALVRLFPWYGGLSAARQIALLDMAFMGPEKLTGFVHMIAAIQSQDWQTAADEIARSRWAADVGPNRTRDVCTLMRDGVL